MVHARAAIALDGAAEKAQFAHLVHDLAMKFLVPIRFQDPGLQLFLTVGVRRIADLPLFAGKLILEEKRIFPMEMGLAVGGVHGGVR